MRAPRWMWTLLGIWSTHHRAVRACALMCGLDVETWRQRDGERASIKFTASLV